MKGGPSGSGKTSLAYKMANIVGCEVISLENYYKSEQVREFKYDDFTSLDLPLLLKVCVFMMAFIQVLYIYVHPHLLTIKRSYM
jgi:uridine kinase